MSGLELNKIAASIFLAGLIAMISGFIADGLYHEGTTEKRGYKIEGAEEAATAATAPTEAAKPVDIAPYMAKADLALGEKLLARCVSCHHFEKDGKNAVGPGQWDVVGRKIASHEGFNYSDALKKRSAETWDFQHLSEFLAAPQKYAPGTRMAFAGIKKPEERAALIAYINKTYSDKPLPLPAK